MNDVYRKTNIPIYVGVTFLLCLILIAFTSIMTLNNGLFIYTLDDPYIHLALAENIKKGHYGINLNEFSAPSSSALWPFLLAPFSAYPYSPFFINIVAAIASVVVLVKIVNLSIHIENIRVHNTFISAITVLFILATNVVGLVYTGMEHSLQLLAVLLIAYGLIIEIKHDKVEWWLLAAIIIAPLVRYECMAISLAAVSYLLMRRHFKPAGIALLLLVVCLGGFSVFLMSLGLDAFPSSVTAKSSVVQSGGGVYRLVKNLIESLHDRRGIILLFGALILLFYVFFVKDDVKRKQLAAVTIIAVCMHIVAGRYGWFNRYEIYILAFELIVISYLLLSSVSKRLLESNTSNFNLFTAISFAAAITIVIGSPYIRTLILTPQASNNIYEQQYQMYRFTANFYRKPIAANDIGYVSYKNSHHVLDLWGLGSQKALKSRLSADNPHWMQDLIAEEDVKLVMIYEDWFNNIPDEWIKVGELHLGNKKITPARSMVAFYSTDQASYPEILDTITRFSRTLPDKAKFKFEGK